MNNEGAPSPTEVDAARQRNDKRYARFALKSYAVIFGTPVTSFIIGYLSVRDAGLGALAVVALLLLGTVAVMSIATLTLLVRSILYLKGAHSKGALKVLAIVSIALASVASALLLFYLLRMLNGHY